MSSREDYFPDNTSIDVINDTIYTDYGFLADIKHVGGYLNDKSNKDSKEEDKFSEPPF